MNRTLVEQHTMRFSDCQGLMRPASRRGASQRTATASGHIPIAAGEGLTLTSSEMGRLAAHRGSAVPSGRGGSAFPAARVPFGEFGSAPYAWCGGPGTPAAAASDRVRPQKQAAQPSRVMPRQPYRAITGFSKCLRRPRHAAIIKRRMAGPSSLMPATKSPNGVRSPRPPTPAVTR